VAPLLVAKDLKLTFPTKRVFDAVTLSIDNADRIGVVGRNGDGKSSLLRLLIGELTPDSGEVMKRSDVTIGILHQKDALDPKTTALQAATGNTQVHEWAAERRSREIIETLLADINHDAPIEELSGGQRRRVDLARLLIGSWDILMLDEPTNHLDMQTITWLAEHLKARWPQDSGALLVVTHDRWFLDEVCLGMWEVHDGRVSPFEGGYSAYVLQRVERDRLLQLAEEKRQNQMRKVLAWLSRGARARATKPKFHLKIARELIADEPEPRNTLELKRVAMTRLGKQVIEFKEVTEILGGKTLLKESSFLIGPGDRLGILGANGVGKTTLLRLMLGELTPTAGQVKIGATVQMAYLSQQLGELEGLMDRRVLEVLDDYKRGHIIDGKYVSSLDLLQRLGFEREYFMARIRDLSGGQRRRLQLLLTLLKEPNVLILDEPGNDFDTDMLVVFEDLLDTWPGTLVLVSHDRYLVERVTDMQYALVDGALRHLPGGVDEFLCMTVDELGLPRLPKSTPLERIDQNAKSALTDAQDKQSATQSFEGSQGSQSSQDSSSPRAVLSASEAHEARKQLASMERKISTLEKKIEQQKAALLACDPTDYLALGAIQDEMQNLQAKLFELEASWLDLSEKLG